MSKINNFQFDNIAASYHGAYTMEFWIFTELITDVTFGVTVLMDKHVGIVTANQLPL